MSTTEINSIIEYLTKNGLTPEDVENNGGYAKVNAELHVMLDYKFTFDQGCSYYLNSFATDWEIYKRYLKVVFNVRNAQELVMTLKKCVEQFNV